jgi:NACalpha-BTF3-like transcription factor
LKKKGDRNMQITLEAVEKVMEQTGVDYKAAKEALVKTDGDVDAAIKLISPDTKDLGDDIKEMMDKLKKKVEEGNVDRIQIKKGDEVVFSVPVNVGIVGGLLGLAAAPWALIAGSVAAFGLGCRLEVVKKDGTTDEIK